MPLRIVFMGTPAFAVPSLALLTERPDLCQVVAVFSQPDRPSGRGRKVTASPVKIAAQGRGIPSHEPTRMRTAETTQLLADLRPDLVVVAAYGRILPPALLAIPPRGCINVHASLLPRFRGASPIAHAILAGDAEAGVCIMGMEEGLDTGPVFSRAALPIGPEETTGSLTIKLAELGAELLVKTLPSFINGTAQSTPQPAEGVTYAPLLAKENGWLELQQPAAVLERQVRAFHPWPGTFVSHAGARLKVLRAHAQGEGAPAGSQPGVVLQANAQGVQVACGEGTLWLDEVQPEGRKPMAAAAWVAGRGIAQGALLSGLTTK